MTTTTGGSRPVQTAVDPAGEPVHADVPPADPFILAKAWLHGPVAEHLLMTVSTVGADGAPRARTTMLSEFDGERFFFHTDAASAKVTELAAEPRVVLTVLWPGFARQLVVQGSASVAPAEETEAAYRQRGPYLQQLAWQNTAEFARRPLADRRAAWAAFQAEHGGPDEPRFSPPSSWVGYAVTPERLLFWAGSPVATSRRLEYTRDGAGWTVVPLPG